MLRRLVPTVAFFAALVLACDLAVVAVHLLDDHTTLIAGKPRQSLTATTEEVVPAAGQAFVTGTIESLAADNAQVEPLATPLTIRGERGVARVTIEKALISGKRVTINWDGGTPMPITGAGGLDFGTTHVEVTGDGIAYSLDGAPRSFVAGTYSIGTSVAVGTTGVATPQDRVSFTADAQTVLISKGGPTVRIDLQKIDLLGPGKLKASGKLKVQFPDRSVNATAISFGEGPYRITVDPGAGGLEFDAILQGQVDAS